MTTALDQLLTATDDFGVTGQDYKDANDAFSRALVERVTKRCRTVTGSFLFTYDMPKDAPTLLYFAQLVWSAALTYGVVDGFIVPTEAGTATPEEKAEFEKLHAAKTTKGVQQAQTMERLLQGSYLDEEHPAGRGGAYL
jgi:hypothetical protein